MATTYSIKNNYTAPVYDPPNLFRFVGSILERPIETRSTSFSTFFSNDVEAQSAYVEGLFGLGSCFAAFCIFWFACLIIFKCKDKEVGCAAGYGFDGIPRRRRRQSQHRQQETGALTELQLQQHHHQQSNNINGHHVDNNDDFCDEVDIVRALSKSDRKQILGYRDHSTSTDSTDSSTSSNSSHNQRVKTLIALEEYESDASVHPQSRFLTQAMQDSEEPTFCGFCSSKTHNIEQRRWRTRIAFLFCCVLSITCSLLLFKKVRAPMEAAAVTTAGILLEGHAILDDVQSTLNVMEDAATVADTVITTIPFDFAQLCPDVPLELFSSEFAVNPSDVVAFLEEEFETFLESTAFYIGAIQEKTWQIENGLTQAGATVQENEDMLWVLTFWVGVMVALTSLAIVGVLVAVREDAQPTFSQVHYRRYDTRSEIIMTWAVLPTLIIFTILGWCLLIIACTSTVVTTDLCLAGPTESPEGMIRQILNASDVSPDEIAYTAIVAYTEGCQGQDPIQELVALENILSDNLILMRARLEEADAVGYDTMKDRCGEGNHIDVFFTGVSNLAGHLALVQNALSEVTDSLSCHNVNDLYTRSVHGVLCTDVASASASGFVLLLVICLASMTLITLRASWRISR